MSRCTRRAIALLSVSAGLILRAGGVWAQPAPTPWLLTTEAQLQGRAVPAAIEAFWTSKGRARNFQGQDGLKLAGMAFVQADRSRERGAIVLVSGRTETMLKYKETVYDLYRNGYTVYLHDHRGQGLSEREAATRSEPQKGYVRRFDDYVLDLRQFIAQHVVPARHARVFLWAHSMGGAISAALLESDAPELQHIRAAVLSSPMLQIEGMVPMLRLPADILSCNLARARVHFGHETDYHFGGGGYKAAAFESNPYTHSAPRYARFVAQYASVPRVRLGSPTWGWLARSCDAAQAVREGGAQVRLPLLLMVAGGDRIVHNAGARAFCLALKQTSPAGCGGEDGGPVEIPDANHELFIEVDAMRRPAMERALQFLAAQ